MTLGLMITFMVVLAGLVFMLMILLFMHTIMIRGSALIMATRLAAAFAAPRVLEGLVGRTIMNRTDAQSMSRRTMANFSR